MTKKLCSLLLLCLLSAVLLTGCGGEEATPASAVDMDTLQQAMLDAAPSLPEMLTLTDQDGSADQFSYLSALDYDKVDAFFLAYAASGQQADEIAVIAVKDTDDLAEAEASLKEHQANRLKLYQQYGPDQASRVEQGLVFTKGNCAVLIICDEAQAVKDAFDSAFDANS
jgi:uncharacterized protein YrzB (UPF0473 family)